MRELTAAQVAGAAGALAGIVERGMPNRFGPQRFGRDGDNALAGRAVLTGEGAVPRGNAARRFAVFASSPASSNILAMCASYSFISCFFSFSSLT